MRRAVCILLLCLSLLPFATAGRAAEAAALRSVQAGFIQEKHLKILTRPLVSRGSFAFQAPQSLRWEYLVPLHSILIMHDGRVEKAVERDGRFERETGGGIDSMQLILRDLGSWLDGRFADNPMFSVSRRDARTIVLAPRDPGLETVISRIELCLGREPGVMESVTIFEGPDAWTRLTFTGTVVNRDIPAALFRLP